MKILRNFVLVLMIVLGVGLCFNPTEKVNAASGIGTVTNIKKSKIKHVWDKKINGKVCSGNYRTITWKKVKGANGYVVYRYDDLLNEWNKVLTTKTNSFIISSLLQDETFTIKICAYKKCSVGKFYGEYSKEFKYKENTTISLRNKKKLMTKGCYAEGKDGYCEYASKQAFIIQNQYRIEKNVSPLVWSKELYNVAKIRSKELTRLYSHTRPNGEKSSSAIEEYLGVERCNLLKKTYENSHSETIHVEQNNQYVTTKKIFMINNSYGENIGLGNYGVLNIMLAWKKSISHYNNLCNSNYEAGSICVYSPAADNIEYWTSSFEIINIDEIK